MATRKQYADIQVYEKKLDTVMKRLGVEKYDWNSDRHGGWVEFWYNGQLYRFEHDVENAKAHGSNLVYGSDAFAQIVLALEDLARIVTRGIYDLSVWVSGMKALPQYVPLPAFCTVLELDHIPLNEEEIERQYGVIETNYIYNQEGLVEPEILSVADRAALSEYENLSGYYLRARILYERTLSLDYELSLNPDASLSVAMDYNAMLDDVAKLTVDIDAAQFGTEYSSIKSQLLNWVKTDIAVYLQNISAAITNNDGEKANNAMVSRDVMYADFATLTSNMAALCNSTAGAKNGDIFNWSPESYVATLSGSN